MPTSNLGGGVAATVVGHYDFDGEVFLFRNCSELIETGPECISFV